jgi:hypothetical protein
LLLPSRQLSFGRTAWLLALWLLLLQLLLLLLLPTLLRLLLCLLCSKQVCLGRPAALLSL